MLLGVSTDTVETQAEFKAQENLPFTLLADVDHDVAEQYGVWVENEFDGVKVWENERTTFVIGPDGLIKTILRRVDHETHSQQLLETLAGLQSPARR